MSVYHFLVNDEHVEDGVAVGVLVVGVGVPGQNQPVAFLLAEAGGETERVLAPVHVAVVICQRIAVNLDRKINSLNFGTKLVLRHYYKYNVENLEQNIL